jgi:hypothetical protein
MRREDEVIDKAKIKITPADLGGFFYYMEEAAKLLMVIFFLIILFAFD